MKMARASNAEFDLLVEFFNFIEEFMEYGTHTPDNPDVEEESIELDDGKFVAMLREKWGRRFGPALVDAAWRRVVFGGQIAIENACDPSLDYLDFKPEIKTAVESYEAAKGG